MAGQYFPRFKCRRRTAGTCWCAQVVVQDWSYYANGNAYWPDGLTGQAWTVLKIMFRSTDVSYPHVQIGDRIQLGTSGQYYQIVYDPGPLARGTKPYDFYYDNSGFVLFPPGSYSNPEPTGNQPQNSGTDAGYGSYMLDWRLTAVLAPTSSATPTPTATVPNYSHWPYPSENPLNPVQYTANTSFFQTYFCRPVPFLVARQPVPNSATPIRLDPTTAIDLALSGCDSGVSTLVDTLSFELTNASGAPDTLPVTILFSPTGELQSLWVNNTQWPSYRNPVYLMIG